MALHPLVLSWISSLPPDQQQAYMVSLQLAFSAEAANSTPPSASVDNFPLTAIESPTTPLEEPSRPEESREWEPPDEEELASYRQHPLEPQAEPEHPGPRPASNPERADEFISTAEVPPRDEPSLTADPASEPEDNNLQDVQPQPEQQAPQTSLDQPAQTQPTGPPPSQPTDTQPPPQPTGTATPVPQRTQRTAKPGAKPQTARLPRTTPQQPAGPKPPTAKPQAVATDSSVPAKARPPKPTRQVLKPTPATSASDGMAQPPSVPTAVPTFHMDRNKQPPLLEPDEDTADPQAAPSSGPAPAPARVPCPLPVPPICPPGKNLWWLDSDITSPDSPRHQPQPEGDHWYPHDGSWWRNFWPTHGNQVPPEATRANAEHYQYSHDPAFYKGTRIWVHPRSLLQSQSPQGSPDYSRVESPSQPAFHIPTTHPRGDSLHIPPWSRGSNPTFHHPWTVVPGTSHSPEQPREPGLRVPGRQRPLFMR